MYGNAKENVEGLFFFNKYTSFLNKFVYVASIFQTHHHLLILDDHASHTML
jgi:hypothetical protein